MTIQDAILKYPTPKFTLNYFAHFPCKEFWIIEAMLFGLGFVVAVITPRRKTSAWYVQGLATFLFVLVLLAAGTWHTIAWVKMRIVEIKRAKYMGITLQEYFRL